MRYSRTRLGEIYWISSRRIASASDGKIGAGLLFVITIHSRQSRDILANKQ